MEKGQWGPAKMTSGTRQFEVSKGSVSFKAKTGICWFQGLFIAVTVTHGSRMTAPVTSVDVTDPALWGAALDPSLVVKSDLCRLHPEQHPKNKDIVSDIVCFIFKLCIRVHPNVSQGCQGGCATCSDYNGCLSCKPRLFFVLERIGMKQIGVCLSSCPSGYYGTRYPDINKCAKCKADCDTCFTRNFCTKCKSGFYLYSGKCLEKCPDGLEANNHTMECTSIMHCEASEWSPWSPCTKKGKTCGFKRGNEVRVREIVQHPSARGNPCPATSESRKCIVQRKRCQKEGKDGCGQGEGKDRMMTECAHHRCLSDFACDAEIRGRMLVRKKNREEKRKKSNKDESKETRQENKGRAARRQNREQRENNNKTQPKKRKAPNKEQNLAPIDTAH
ncbi:hypothetical protein Q9233_013610 [Columba guinea]|nr:hypothetical protein Q9233_013610 [Columba guinea]